MNAVSGNDRSTAEGGGGEATTISLEEIFHSKNKAADGQQFPPLNGLNNAQQAEAVEQSDVHPNQGIGQELNGQKGFSLLEMVAGWCEGLLSIGNFLLMINYPLSRPRK